MFNNLTIFPASSTLFYDLQKEIRDMFRDFGLEVTGSDKFPLYNCHYTKDKDLVLEIAVAGYAKDQLTIEQDADSLIIKGVAKFVDDKPMCLYTVQQIANKDFTKIFRLTHDIEVKSVTLENGILRLLIAVKGAKDARKTIQIK